MITKNKGNRRVTGTFLLLENRLCVKIKLTLFPKLSYSLFTLGTKMGCLSEVSIFLADTLKLVPMSITQTQPNIRDRGIFYQACEATRVYSFAEANNIIGMMKVFNKFEIFMLHSGNSQMTKNIEVELQKWTFEELFRKRNSMIYLTQSYKCDLDILSTSSGMEDPAL